MIPQYMILRTAKPVPFPHDPFRPLRPAKIPTLNDNVRGFKHNRIHKTPHPDLFILSKLQMMQIGNDSQTQSPARLTRRNRKSPLSQNGAGTRQPYLF